MTVASLAPRRVTVVSPACRVDLALPSEATVAEIVVQLTQLLGLDGDDPTGEGGAWILSRLGAEPFTPDTTMASVGVRDGELLYLTARSAAPVAAVFDDVVDAIARGIVSGGDRWRDGNSRRAGLTTAVVAALAGAAAVLSAGPPWGPPSLVAAGLAVLVTGAAVAASRSLGDSAAGALAAGVAACFAGLSGLTALGGDTEPRDLGAGHLLLGLVCWLLVLGFAPAAIGDHVAWFVGLAALGLPAVLAVVVRLLTGLPAASAAAVGIAVLLPLAGLLPTLALRLARLPFPQVPVDTAEFRRDEPPVLDREVLDRTLLADDLLTALTAALALGTTGLMAVAMTAGGRAAPFLAVAVGATQLLRIRPLLGRLQRLGGLVAGLATLGLTGAVLVAGLGQGGRLGAAAAALVLAGACVALALTVPGHHSAPYVGRTLDILEFLAVASIIPLVVWLTGLYGRVRGLGG